MTQLKVVTVALLGASDTGKKSLAAALTQALASTLSTLSTPLHWKITTDTALQGLLARGDADVDNPSPEFQAALAQQRRFDHRLLLGLDLAPSAGTLQIQSAEERSRIDTLLRRSLTQAGMPFQVIYGTGDERLRQALAALVSPAVKANNPPAETPSPRKPWVWACDKCSDPACEHKLLSDLLLNR
jgi:nicotinamide riboside kinase